MTDRDPIPPGTQRSGVRPEGVSAAEDARNRANQEAARRPGVDADNALDHRGHMTATPHEGSAYQPLREGSDEQRQRDEDSAYVLDQGADADDGEGVSRRGAERTHGDERRETESAPGGGSVYHPLADDPRNLEEREDQPRGNPAVPSRQGTGEGGPGEQISERPEHNDPRGMPGETGRG